jgi:cell division protein FtsB
VDTKDRAVQPSMPAAPPLPQHVSKRPHRRWLGAVTVALALGLVASGVFAIMEASALATARSDLADAETEIRAGERRVESLEDEVAKTKGDLDHAEQDLARAREYGDACYSALRGYARGIRLYYQSVRAANRGDVDGSRRFYSQSVEAFRETRLNSQTCMNAPPFDFEIF